MKKTKAGGFCMILGEACYKECPHHYYREFNRCWKPPITSSNKQYQNIDKSTSDI